MSSSQLTNFIIFQRGRSIINQPYVLSNHLCSTWSWRRTQVVFMLPIWQGKMAVLRHGKAKNIRAVLEWITNICGSLPVRMPCILPCVLPCVLPWKCSKNGITEWSWSRQPCSQRHWSASYISIYFHHVMSISEVLWSWIPTFGWVNFHVFSIQMGSVNIQHRMNASWSKPRISRPSRRFLPIGI